MRAGQGGLLMRHFQRLWSPHLNGDGTGSRVAGGDFPQPRPCRGQTAAPACSCRRRGGGGGADGGGDRVRQVLLLLLRGNRLLRLLLLFGGWQRLRRFAGLHAWHCSRMRKTCQQEEERHKHMKKKKEKKRKRKEREKEKKRKEKRKKK